MKRLAIIRNLSTVGLLLIVSLLVGCSGIKTYPNTLDKNLHVRTATDSGSLFSSVRTAVDIHHVGADCTTEYEGTVQLEKPSIKIGIPSNTWSRLVFVFANNSFLANSSSTITYETLLKPRAGYTYEIKVRYQDDIYNVSVQETHPDDPARREVERRTLRACNVFPTQKRAKGSG
jgi:hypothetical protein